MKIYKLAVFYNDEFVHNVRLPFVPFGTFKGFRLKDEELVAVFDMRIEQGYECFNYKGELELKLNETFDWPEEYMRGDGPSDWESVTLGYYKIQLVYVDAEEEDIFTLYNGVEVPRLGFGTWLIENEVAPEVVKNAINAGYIHLDSAQAYGNEEGIKEAIKNSLFKREDIFITSKVRAEIKNHEDAKKSIDESLRKLGVDYIDLMLIHCPMPWKEYDANGGYRYEKENLDVWKAMVEAYKEGKLRSIGVSNFNIEDLKNIINNSEIKPMVNQIPIHLGKTQKELVDFCHKENIMVEAYSPLAHARLLNDEMRKGIYLAVYEVLNELNAVQIMLSYASSYSDIILPKASSLDHMLDNMKYEVKLKEETLKKIEEAYDNLRK